MTEFFIVYDNDAVDGYIADWGFSCYIKAKERFLFDTGADENILRHNLSLAGIDDFDYVFLSHEHWDHVGGLKAVLNRTSYLVIPRSFSNRFKRDVSRFVEVLEIRDFTEICKGFYSTGELGTFVKEHSLIVEVGRGYVVVTGCSHPGLDVILNVAESVKRIIGVIGGFHGFSKIEMLEKYEIVVPCHCTAYKKEILRMRNARRCFAGCRFDI